MTWLYKQTEKYELETEKYLIGGLWTVGFYDPNGKWVAESDWTSPDAAAERVHYLNGATVFVRVPQPEEAK